MRFFVTGEQNKNKLLNTIVSMFVGYMLIQWVSNALMFFNRMTLSKDSVVAYYLGSPENFTEPKSYESLLEVSHAHFFSMGMLAVTLTHLLLFANVSPSVKIRLSSLIFLSAISDEIAGWLVRFVHADFAWFKLISFITLEGSLGLLIILVGISRFRTRSEGEHRPIGKRPSQVKKPYH